MSEQVVRTFAITSDYIGEQGHQPGGDYRVNARFGTLEEAEAWLDAFKQTPEYRNSYREYTIEVWRG